MPEVHFLLPGLTCCNKAGLQTQLTNDGLVAGTDFIIDGNQLSILNTTCSKSALRKKYPLIKTYEKSDVLRKHWILGIIGLILGVGAFILCSWVALPWFAMCIVAGVSTLAVGVLGYYSFKEAWDHLRSGRITMDSLFAMSATVIVCSSILSLFFPILPMMFEAGLLILAFRHIGLAIEHMFTKSAFQGNFASQLPKTVTLSDGDSDWRHYSNCTQ